MKPVFAYPLILVLVAAVLFGTTACQKIIASEDQTQTPNAQNSSVINANNTRLSYGDSIFYLRASAAANRILPVRKPSGAGYFKSVPKGLSIDSATGRIDLALSETGLRYKIYYVLQSSNNASDSVSIVVSGIDYEDRVYTMNATPNAYDTAFPIYNARPNLPLPCTDDDDDDDDDGCIFDETDLNNDGNDDIAGVIQSKLLVDKKLGTLDLEASFNAGIFGNTNPANGTEKTFTMYYRLNDASNKALNKIAVRIIYYERRSQIPQSLLQEIAQRQNTRIAIRNIHANQVVAAGPSAGNDVVLTGIEEIERKSKREKRPPMIILTRSL
jgi:hypothetical protein